MTSPSTGTRIALLADRGVVRVAAEDAWRLLQGVITGDMELLSAQPAMHAALLTPQGKILFDFFVVKAPGGFLLETAADKAADLAKRLTMYKLRAKADIQDRSAAYRVFAAWGSAPSNPDEGAGETHVFPDPRLGALGWRGLTGARLVSGLASAIGGVDASPEDYHAHRIALGVPEGGKDYAFGDAFPHEADLDQLHGVSFTKGCFVGQEVVSRMQNRASVRKRVVPVAGEAPLTTGAEIRAGAAVIGAIGSTAGMQALALVRLDRAAEAVAKGETITAGGVAIALRKPDWATFDLAPAVTAGAS
jgi:folate-binding protein YgfZ